MQGSVGSTTIAVGRPDDKQSHCRLGKNVRSSALEEVHHQRCGGLSLQALIISVVLHCIYHSNINVITSSIDIFFQWVITDARHDSTANAYHTTVPCLSGRLD